MDLVADPIASIGVIEQATRGGGMSNLRTFVVQCRDCDEDVVFKQAASTTAEHVMLRPVQLRCGACCTTHVYAPIEFVAREIDP
jgi:hypothetical protein